MSDIRSIVEKLGDKTILKVIHNAGLLSCYTVRLTEIIKYFNETKILPDIVDSSIQFQMNKSSNDDVTPYFFKNNSNNIDYREYIPFWFVDDDIQFTNYENLRLDLIRPLVKKYFEPSKYVNQMVNNFMQMYGLDLSNLCSVFYRGLDKINETDIAPPEVYIKKCKKIKIENPNINFFVQTDETNFLESFLKEFPDSIYLKELPQLPNIGKNNYTVTHHINIQDRLNFTIAFLSSLIIVSKCKILVTHSGNCGLWAVLYRDSLENVYQHITGSNFYNKKHDGYWNK